MDAAEYKHVVLGLIFLKYISDAFEALGRMTDRTHRELTDEDIAKIAGTYHAWRRKVEVSAKTQRRNNHKAGGLFSSRLCVLAPWR